MDKKKDFFMKTQRTIASFSLSLRKRKNQKNIILKVTPPFGDLVLSAPSHVSNKDLEAFVSARKDWIIKNQAKFAKARNTRDEGLIYLWGRAYKLEFIKDNKNAFKLCDSKMIFFYKGDLSGDLKDELLDDFYRKSLKTKKDDAIKEVEELTGLKADEYRLRKMKTRWGSCNISKKRVWLNTNLAKYEPICLIYVLVHELCHLLEPNHSKSFYDLVESFFPEYKKAEALLKEPKP